MPAGVNRNVLWRKSSIVPYSFFRKVVRSGRVWSRSATKLGLHGREPVGLLLCNSLPTHIVCTLHLSILSAGFPLKSPTAMGGWGEATG